MGDTDRRGWLVSGYIAVAERDPAPHPSTDDDGTGLQMYIGTQTQLQVQDTDVTWAGTMMLRHITFRYAVTETAFK